MTKAGILMVEDDLYLARATKLLLEKFGYTVVSIVASGEEAVKKAEEERPDLALIDIGLEGDMDGIEVADVIYSKFDIPVIYITAYGDSHTIERAEKTKHYGYIIKPFNPEKLDDIIKTALNSHAEERKASG